MVGRRGQVAMGAVGGRCRARGGNAGSGDHRRHHPADAVQPDPVRRPLGWAGDTTSQGWAKVEAASPRSPGPRRGGERESPSPAPARKLSVCVLPFVNMSGDPEQEYFSDGISEDIITDLSKISALSVIARNTAFTFKGKARRERGGAGARRQPCARGQRAQGRQTGSESPPS